MEDEQAGPDGFRSGFAWIGRQLQQVRYRVEDGQAVADGCIILGPVEKIEALTRAARGPALQSAGAGLKPPPFIWPDRTIIYQIDADLLAPERVTSAIDYWRANTFLKFVERTPANSATYPHFVRVVNGAGCWSAVGCQGGEQKLQLGPSCTLGEVKHEIGHAVGLFHEHARSDRDQWVKIVLDKVELRNRTFLRDKISPDKEFGEYDYGSIMHYPIDAFTTDHSASIIPLKPTNAQIGQRLGLSKRDIATIEHLYSQPPPEDGTM